MADRFALADEMRNVKHCLATIVFCCRRKG